MQEKKKHFRAECRARLRRERLGYHAQKTAINQEICSLLKNLGAKKILLYYPLRSEVDLRPTLFALKKQRGIKVFLPKIAKISFDVVRFSLPLQKNSYGILECNTRRVSCKLDAMVVPILGMDGNFARVGFGKGMYDRFFASLKKKPKVIFIAKKFYFSKDIITQDFDIQGDYFISSFYKIKKAKNVKLPDYQLFGRRPICGDYHFFLS
ncbi:5-formyltetrahydrofolate cyclo-ligase [Helicobacter mustelae]|uniref:5-formyltetrahydrofolate cyclo-ligase n=1 Tax=Helicobacter mustelae TaxID=217 RepID=UPI000324A79F|nr:5-formyltetrahydrofolate cyclo-ligase [Helicobacter mustelae]